MTERLYYNDSYLRSFDAQVVQCVAVGDQFRATLDRTAFYPTSGGQPFDTGLLGAAQVVDVQDEEDGIVHVLDRPVSGAVQGTVDWARRFDHMQQHTGQHILSAAFVELFGFPTVSFHLGREACTIDLPQQPSPQQLEAAEQRANEVVFSNLAVEVLYGTAAELEKIGIRKAVDREGVLRAVAIGSFDRQPCGGTHVAHSGEVGIVLVRKVEKQKQNYRIEFVCGARALLFARRDCAALNDAARSLGCGPAEVTTSVQRMIDAQKTSQKRQLALLENLAIYEAAALLAASPAGPPRRVLKVFDDAEAAYLRLLATEIAKQPDAQALLATHNGGNVIFAQSKGLPADMNQLLREAVGKYGGKGGGTRDFAQGAIPDSAQLQALLASVPFPL